MLDFSDNLVWWEKSLIYPVRVLLCPPDGEEKRGEKKKGFHGCTLLQE